jgi:exopolysaccharide biosynthesis protein
VSRTVLNSFASLALTFVITLVTRSVSAQSWERVSTDLEMMRLDVEPTSLFSGEILLLRSELKQLVPRVVPALQYGKKLATAEELATKSQALVTINANFFDENGKALGLVVTNGTLQQPPHYGGAALTGVFQVNGGNSAALSIVHRSAFNPRRVLEAFQAGPRLLASGQLLKVKDASSSRRAGLCLDTQDRLILFVTSGLFGATLNQLQKLLLDKRVNCHSALNLDGGGSAQLYFRGGTIPENGKNMDVPEINIEGIDSVPVVLGLFSK